MFCAKCGENLPDGAQFCPKCGAAASSPAGNGDPASPPAPEPSAGETKTAAAVKEKPRRKRGRTILLAVVALVAAVVLLSKLPSSLEDGPAERDADAELLAVIDEAEAVHQKAMDDCTAVEEEDDGEGGDAAYVERTRREVQILNDFLTELEALRGKAEAVSGPDAKLLSARDEYFHMLHDSRTALIEIYTFIADYIAFFDETVAYRPFEIDYDSSSEYSQVLSAWLQEAREGYAAISYPSSVESEWKQYGTILEYNANIIEKLEEAVQYNDCLRLCSTKNLTNRYDKAESAQYTKLLDCLAAEKHHASNQYWIASDLAEEMRIYAELTPEEKDTYEFKNIRTGKILLNYDVVDTIYPSLYNTYDAFLIFKTGCISGNRAIVVEAEIEGFTQKYQQSYNLDSSYKAIYIKPPALTGELDLSAAKPAQIKITVSEKDGTLIDAKTFDVTLKSKTDFDWYSDAYGAATQDNILCFLTPEAAAITELKRQAASEISKITGGAVESFWGYQSVNSEWNQYLNTYLQAAGLMSALNEMGVRYVMNPFAISGSGQHINLPEDVLANRSGLCVETSLVIASALQSAGMHAFLVFPRGHAMVAVEVWNKGENAGEYFLIETTAIEASANADLFNENANWLYSGYLPENWEHDGYKLQEPVEYLDSDKWADYVENYFEYVVDCNDSRLLGLTPFAN